MLPLGSLFTQLPLLAISAIYVLFMGFNAISGERLRLQEDKEHVAEIGNFNNAAGYYVPVTMPLHGDACEPEPCFIAHPDYFVNNFVFRDKETPVSSFYDINILSRPPPES